MSFRASYSYDAVELVFSRQLDLYIFRQLIYEFDFSDCFGDFAITVVGNIQVVCHVATNIPLGLYVTISIRNLL